MGEKEEQNTRKNETRGEGKGMKAVTVGGQCTEHTLRGKYCGAAKTKSN